MMNSMDEASFSWQKPVEQGLSIHESVGEMKSSVVSEDVSSQSPLEAERPGVLYHPGDHGCPINCEYCVITEVESRRKLWNQKTLLAINKAATIVNPPPDQSNQKAREEFYGFPIDLLKGDVVGFNAISDPFWPKYQEELQYFLNNVPQIAKLAVFVTKWNISDQILDQLAEIPNARLTVSITGLDGLERTKTAHRLSVLRRAKERNIKTFPIIHPYISGMTDLSFLLALRDMGYDQIDVKGLRYNPKTMDRWMPESSQILYRNSGEQEVLPEDGWREQVNAAGLHLVPPREWYRFGWDELSPHLERAEAEALTKQVFDRANVTSSDSNQSVFDASVGRRM